MAGKVVRCTKCQTQLKVPGGSSASPTRSTPQAAARPTPPQRQPEPESPFGSGDPFADLPSSTSGGAFDNLATPPAPSAATNPYAVPQQRSAPKKARKAGGLPSGRSAALYTVPAVLMMVWAVLVILGGILQLGMLGYLIASGKVNMQQVDTAHLAGRVAGQLVAIVLQVVVFSGCLKMMQRTGLSSARAAAGISAVPCFGCLAFPIGIWACVLLFSQKAERDFQG